MRSAAGTRLGAGNLRWIGGVTVALLAVAASLSGISNGFALDDVQIIVENERVHSLIGAWRVFTQTYWPPSGGSSLYRPLTSLGFAIQWAVGGGSPLPFHIVSIALYAAVSLAFLRFAELITDVRIAWLSAALFAVHPLHVEAVANVVGQAELWSAFFALLSMTLYVRGRHGGRLSGGQIAAITGSFATGLMFKEHVIVLPALILALELMVLRRDRRIPPRFVGAGRLAAWLSIAGVAFVAMRTGVIGNVHGGGVSPIFSDDSFGTRLFTMLRVTLEWIRLFFWPAGLSADYSPSRIVIAEAFTPDMIPAVIVIAGVAMLAVFLRRTAPVAAFAITWAGIALIIPSNLLVVTGFVLAERTLFLASAGVMLACAIAVVSLVRMSTAGGNHGMSSLVTAGVAAVLMLGIARSSSRNQVWHDNASLFTQTVEDAPASARARMMLAQLNIERGKPARALAESRVALTLGPEWDPQLFAFAGDVYQMNGRCASATKLYARSLSLWPQQPQVRINAAICLARTGRPDAARALLANGGALQLAEAATDGE